jgi:putative hydrolase of the HAD superfamily
MQPAVRALVLDYGQVICRPPSAEEWTEFSAAARMPIDEFIRSYAISRERYDRGLVRADEYWREFGRLNGLEYDAATRRRLAQIDIRIWSHIDHDLVADVRALKRTGIATGILSNMQPDLLDVLRREAVWLEAFDVRVFSCEVGYVKPERQVYDELVSRMKAEASQILFLDDLLVNVEAARAAGLKAEIFTSPGDLRRILDSAV